MAYHAQFFLFLKSKNDGQEDEEESKEKEEKKKEKRTILKVFQILWHLVHSNTRTENLAAYSMKTY